ncbi:BQ5605_C003g02149 [Microbotryum silenes-dioicae]|uniref:BQ5605_C003g02149 protein n=1 Tax=Microbotryum silenes-dioicae TaxID=796604 RepID=A0A2X0MVF4_9BASI|nr:BQ5605_C003g02149 [Microbotryum silenes-dioicae]
MAASNIATNSSNNSLQHILFECQPSSCFFTASCGRIDFVRLRIRVIGTPNLQRITQENRLWSRDLLLTIPWQVLNVSVRWGDHHVGRGSEAMSSRYSTAWFGVVTVVGSETMPSRYSTARFGVVTVVLAGDPKQCHPVIPRLSAVECGPSCWQEIRSNAFPLFHGSVRWSDRRVGRGSEAMPSRYSTARCGGVWAVVLAGDPKQCLPVIPKCCISLCSRQIGLELATPEGVVVEALPRIRDKFYQEMSAACSIDPVADPQQLGSVGKSEAMPSRYSTARFGGVTVVLAGDPKQCIPVILKPATTKARARAFRSGPTQFFAEPCLYRINIDVCEVARGARRRT